MNEQFKSFNPNIDIVKDAIFNFIIPLIALSISIAAGILIAYPAYKEIPLIKEKITSQTEVYSKLSSKNEVLKKLVDYKSVVDENGNMLNKLLVSEPSVPELLTQIDQIITEAGMTVTKLSYSYGTAKEDTGYNSIEVSMSADGTYDQLVQLLENMENAARLINVSTFRYNYTPATTTGEAPIRANFSLVSPYLLVESTASTDEPVTVDITAPDFLDFMTKVKSFRYYDIRVPIFPLPRENELLIGVEGGDDGENPNNVVSGGTTPPASPGVQSALDAAFPNNETDNSGTEPNNP